MPHFVEGLNRAYTRITFVDYRMLNIDYNTKKDVVVNSMRLLPIRWADQILGKPYRDVMRAKYDLYGMDWKEWKRFALPIRYMDKEKELAEKVGAVGEYNLINNYFGSDSKFNAQIEINNGLPNVNMQTFPGYSLFDWASIVENATNIHVASSSILYLLELLHLKAKEVHLYARKPIEPHFDNVSYLFTKEYILHA